VRFGVLGTGTVGRTLASKLVTLGHEVMMGSRQAGNAVAVAWEKERGQLADEGNFAEAAGFGELVVNATAGASSLDALVSAQAENLAGKVLLDVSNPIEPAGGMPLTLTVCNVESLAEQIQHAFPETRVVKSLNTVNAAVMVDPASLRSRHTMFLAGDDADAKRTVTELLADFGWPAKDVMDLGGIEAARGMEMYLPLWASLWGVTGTASVTIKVVAE
jgi:predicted dinucleotide-binding enzyme